MVVFLSIVLMYVIGCVIAMFLFAQQVLFRMRINSGYKHLNLLDVLFNGSFWRECGKQVLHSWFAVVILSIQCDEDID